MKKTDCNLVPYTQNTTPDYYCTWQTQLYATSDGKPQGQRAIIGERGLFSHEKPYGWAYFYEQARSDLFLVMDDSWDVPLDNDSSYYGSLQLSREKFPESYENAQSSTEALGNLVTRIRSLGWRGLGGWVCSQESPRIDEGAGMEAYWRARLAEANEADLSYWKVDWGERRLDLAYRRMLTDVARKVAPRLTVESACNTAAIPYSDVFRTYDVPAIFSIPLTVSKLRDCLGGVSAAPGYRGLINCEDEAYVAAAGGFVMGIMRHPYSGVFPNGLPDMSFPAVHRNLKTKITEITRAVRWHRIAPAFGADGCINISDTLLHDSWEFSDVTAELEAWWFNTSYLPLFERIDREGMAVGAPASVSRHLPLPRVEAKGEIPYTVAARNPNGAVSVATLGRTYGKTYEIPRAQVELETKDATLFGVFGEYESLTLRTTHTVRPRVLMQDLAAATAYDVTDEVVFADGCLTLSGSLIHRIGTEAQPDSDTSEPGVVIRLEF